jgi:hypothetical protein
MALHNSDESAKDNRFRIEYDSRHLLTSPMRNFGVFPHFPSLSSSAKNTPRPSSRLVLATLAFKPSRGKQD